MGRDFRKLKIWQLAYNIVLDVYPLLDGYPEYEKRNVVDQIRRAVTSLPLNIAEGSGSNSNKVYLTYLGYAYKSAKELDVLFMMSRDLGYIELDVYEFVQKKLEEFKARLYKFMLVVEKEVHDKHPHFTYRSAQVN